MDENKIIIEFVKNRPWIYNSKECKGKSIKDKERDWEEIKSTVKNYGLKVPGILFLYIFL